MRTTERLKEANARIARALDRARVARQKIVYDQKESAVKALNEVVAILERRD